MIAEILKFIVYSSLIVLISKFLLVRILRNLAENLNLRANIVGNIAGIATSIPEFLTVTISSFTGLMNASIFNILSSNVINFFQYIFSITFNRNLGSKRMKTSTLDKISGVGEKRRNELLKYFKTIDAIKKADINELKRIVPTNTAQAVYDFFHSGENKT